MYIHYLAVCLIIIFPISEIMNGVIKRARKNGKRTPDHISELILWLVITISVTLAVILRKTGPFCYSLPDNIQYLLVSFFMILGMIIRWRAIITLGKYFTFNIAIYPDHHLVQSGIYKHIRHPSYSGLILIFTGMGIYFENWLSLLILTIPITAVLIYRISIEERLLHQALGKKYEDYCSKTKRFIPHII